MVKLPMPVMLVSMLIAAALIPMPFIEERPRLRYCGHSTTIWEEIKPWRMSHCCRAGRLVSTLRNIYLAQEINLTETGTYFTNLTDLAEKNFLRRDFTICFHPNTTDWSVTVPHQQGLPGSYLMTSNGSIYFNQTGQATTNDYVLFDPQRPYRASKRPWRFW